MRPLFFLIFFIFILAGQSVFSEESNTSNGSNTGVPNNNSESFPYGFLLSKHGVLDDKILHIPEDPELGKLLGSNFSESTMKFDWQNLLGSSNNGDSRFLLGGLPFFGLPNDRNIQVQEPTIFSPERFTLFWYFNQKF